MKFRRKKNAANDKDQRQQLASRQSYMFSYHALRTEPSNIRRRPEARQHRGEPSSRAWQRWWQYIPSYVAILALIVCALYVLSLDTQVKVTQYINPGEKQYLRAISLYQAAAEEEFGSSILNRSKLTVDTRQISARLEERFPELAEVAITLPFFGRKPVMELIPAKPVLLLTAKNGAFALDKNGRAIIRAEEAPGLSAFSLPRVTDEAGVTIETGRHVLPKDNVDFVIEILGQLEAKQLSVSSITLPAIVNELHLRIEAQPYFIKLNTEGDARLQIGTYLALLRDLEARGIVPAEYVDVRVDEKAYYK